MSIKTVTVFGGGAVSGALEGSDPAYSQAVELGKALAKAGFTVCNGGYGGTMEAVARGAKEAGGKTIGVTTRQFDASANRWVDREIKMESWSARVLKLIEMGDAYIILAGGTGTLVEVFVVWEMLNKKFFSKPVLIFSRQIEALIREVQSWPKVTSHPNMIFVKTTEDAVKHLLSYAKP